MPDVSRWWIGVQLQYDLRNCVSKLYFTVLGSFGYVQKATGISGNPNIPSGQTSVINRFSLWDITHQTFLQTLLVFLTKILTEFCTSFKGSCQYSQQTCLWSLLKPKGTASGEIGHLGARPGCGLCGFVFPQNFWERIPEIKQHRIVFIPSLCQLPFNRWASKGALCCVRTTLLCLLFLLIMQSSIRWRLETRQSQHYGGKPRSLWDCHLSVLL